MLDASATLAILKDEPGSDRVAVAIEAGAVISAVNLAEVIDVLDRGGWFPHESIPQFDALKVHVVPFSASMARISGELAAKLRGRGISSADRACLATAVLEGFRVVTADRVWADLDIGVEIEVIR
jgi:PIN domain nuclease of toxin-antitoxin system